MMTPQRMREILEQSLADRRLSRGEKSVLSQHLDDSGADAEQLAHFRRLAFGLARAAIDATNGALIVEWLEEIAKVLQSTTSGDKEDMAEAWGPRRKRRPAAGAAAKGAGTDSGDDDDDE